MFSNAKTTTVIAAGLLFAACGTREPAVDTATVSPAQPSAIENPVTATAMPVLSAADSAIIRTAVLEVHKSPTCGCCKKWVEYMQATGFKTVVTDHDEGMDAVKKELGVHLPLQSCHTTKIGDYVIEGHVPAEDVLRLLREKPAVAGLTAPGMPMGSPGMEGPPPDNYDVLSFDKNGVTKVFAKRGPQSKSGG